MRSCKQRYFVLGIALLLTLTCSSCQMVSTSISANPGDASSNDTIKETPLNGEVMLPGDLAYKINDAWGCVAPCGLTSALDETEGSYNYTIGYTIGDLDDGEHTTSLTVVYRKLPTELSGDELNWLESFPHTDLGFFGFSPEEDADITSETTLLHAAQTYQSGSNSLFPEHPLSGYSLALSDGTYVYAFRLQINAEDARSIDALWDALTQSMRSAGKNVFR